MKKFELKASRINHICKVWSLAYNSTNTSTVLINTSILVLIRAEINKTRPNAWYATTNAFRVMISQEMKQQNEKV